MTAIWLIPATASITHAQTGFAGPFNAAPPASAPSSTAADSGAGGADAQDLSAASATEVDPDDDTRVSETSAPQSESRDRPIFTLDELTAELGFEARWQRGNVRTTGSRFNPWGYRQINHYDRFEETIGLDMAGALIDEKFMTFSAAARFGLTQERFDESRNGFDPGHSADGRILEYDLRATLFPAGKITTELIAQKTDDRIPRPFLPSLERNREYYGIHLNYNDAVLPMRLSYEDTDESFTSRGANRIDDERDGERLLTYEATWQPSDTHRLNLRYLYSDRRERFSGTGGRFDTIRNELTLDHHLAFGPDDRNSFDTFLRFQDESGDLDRDRYEAAPQLRLQHTDKLATTWRGQFLKESFDGTGFEQFRGDVGATYNWTDQIISAINIYGLRQNIEHGPRIDEWGGNANLSFSDENKLGTFSGSINIAHTDQRTGDNQRGGFVIDEAVSFRDPLPVYLAHTDIRRFSIVVLDSNRRLMLPGFDYVVVPFGRYTALLRNYTGRIPDRGSVLVSYRYRLTDRYALSRDRVDVRVQQTLGKAWTAFYAGTYQSESVDRTRRFLSYNGRDINRHRAGFTWRKPRGSTTFEYEYNDDDIDPYHAGHLLADATLISKAPHSLDAHAAASYFDFLGLRDLPGRHTTLVDCGVTYRLTLANQLDCTAGAAYRWEDDSLFGRTQGVDLTAGVHWEIGQFTASVEIEYDRLDLPGSDDESAGAWIRLRRSIPVIGPARRTLR